MTDATRRRFLKWAGLGLGGGVLLKDLAPAGTFRTEQRDSGSAPLNLGMASYTFREFPLEETLAMTKRVGLKRIAFKEFHLSLQSPDEKIREVAAKVRSQGLDLYGCGVVYMKTREEVDNAFRYAKAAGMKTIIGVPEHDLLEYVDIKVKEHDIKVAIHNHGPTDEVYPTPESAYLKIRSLDPRIGLCIDAGHTQRSGVDPSESAQRFADRLLDVHIKDVSESSEEGMTVEMGRGVIDIPRFLKTLIGINYKGNVSFEYEKDGKDPLPGVAESVGYVNGVLAVL